MIEARLGLWEGPHLEEALLEAALYQCLPGRQAAGMVRGQACNQRRHQRLLHCFRLLRPATKVAARVLGWKGRGKEGALWVRERSPLGLLCEKMRVRRTPV